MPEHSRNAGRAFSIRVPQDMFKLVEKRLKFKFWDKERERSNRAKKLAEGERRMVAARCLLGHKDTAWVGPPHDQIRAYVCLNCNAYASEPEIKDRGFTFEGIPDWEIHKIFDLDLQRQAQGNPKTFGGFSNLILPGR